MSHGIQFKREIDGREGVQYQQGVYDSPAVIQAFSRDQAFGRSEIDSTKKNILRFKNIRIRLQSLGFDDSRCWFLLPISIFTSRLWICYNKVDITRYALWLLFRSLILVFSR